MAHEIEKLQKKVNDVVKDMSGLKLNSNVVVVQNTNSVRRETCSYVRESDIIGREDDKNKIINLLRQHHGNHNVSLVAIVGIGGLGKTALAQLVYNNCEIKNNFQEIIWVCVSDNFDVKTILKNILGLLTVELLTGEENKSNILDKLQKKLHEELAGKRYLLVLDDIWNESFEKWAQLRTYLMCGAQGSKILVTTRSKTVAQTMGVSNPYVLKGLTPEESWDLLKNITFGDDTIGVNQSLESIGKKIAKKCSGVPLAIRTLGGLLQGKSEEKEWIDILHGAFWKLCVDEESIMPVLKLSYQNLSPQLQQCFSYCALYPKDWNIEKDELIQLWMAHGYLECSDENQSMEDIGNQFVKIFLMKCFFQDAIDHCGDIYSFKMHDLIHDLAMKVAGNNCCYLNSETKRLVGSPMHVMLKSDAFGLLESLDPSKMRTLILVSTENEIEKELSVISKFKYLSALKLLNCFLSNYLCDSIGKFKHLRYLNLFGCYGQQESLSKSISKLVCLQRIVLNEEVEFSTKDISKLINLRHLDIANLKVSEQQKKKKKKTTSRFGKLGVGGQYNCVPFSNWFSPVTNIVEISLSWCHGLKYLPPMERLPFLKSLSMCDLVELEFIYYEEHLLSESFFPSLEKLKLVECRNLWGWRRMKDEVNDGDNNSSHSHHLSFPRLSELVICLCSKLNHMPTFPKLNETLTLTFSRVEALEATLNLVGSIEFSPLSMLKYLKIGGYGLNVDKLPQGWLQNLTSLEHLDIYDIEDKKFHEIEIWFKDDINCILPSLRNIKFWSCSDLKALPVWVCNLSSLQHITILECNNLASLPERIPCLTKLQTLEIIDSPLLVKECETQASATWHKIAHIPNIILKIY